MNTLLKKTREFVFAQQSGIVSSSILIACMLLISRIFGFLRYRVLNMFFTTKELDVFYASFRIPDFLFEVLITGAITATFIPFYLKYSSDKEKQSKIVSSIMNLTFIILGVAIVFLVIFMPILVRLATPGFDEETIKRITTLARLLVVSQLPFLVFGNFLTGLAQAHKSFFIPSLGPAFYNVGIIVSTIFLTPSVGIYSAVYGVVFGSFLFLVVQVPVLRFAGFHYQRGIAYLHEMKQFFTLALPRVLTVFVAQIEATIDLTLASFLQSGSYTILYLAQRLQLFPVSIVGMAFGQASLPYLSEMFQLKKIDEMKRVIIDTLNNLIFISMPLAFFLIVCRTPIVRIVYGGPKFDWESTVLTAFTMSFFALSLPFHTCYYFLTRCYYATLDTKTPFIFSVCAITFNTLLSVTAVLILRLPVWALGITFSIVIMIQVIVMVIVFAIRLRAKEFAQLIPETLKVVIAGVLGALVVYPSKRILDGLIFDTTRTINLFFLLVTSFVIMHACYLFAAWALDAKGLYILPRALVRARAIGRKVSEFFSVVES
jgi:putative peptidoglycan lipid II flippase